MTNIIKDGYLRRNLDEIKANANKKWDFCFVVDGQEGSGKSTFAQQCCKHLDPTFNLDRIVFNSREFMKIADTIKEPGKAIMWDEAIEGGASAESIRTLAVTMKKYFMKMRYKQMYVFLVIPTFFELNKYLAIHRTWGLFHVYAKGLDDRGYFGYFDKNRKQNLYLLGKKFYSYNCQKYNFFGEFNPHWVSGDVKTYEEKKDKFCSIDEIGDKKSKRRRDEFEKMRKQRDSAFKMLREEFKKKSTEMSKNTGLSTSHVASITRDPRVSKIEASRYINKLQDKNQDLDVNVAPDTKSERYIK